MIETTDFEMDSHRYEKLFVPLQAKGVTHRLHRSYRGLDFFSLVCNFFAFSATNRL